MELIAFIPSTDLERSRMFYEGVLGLLVEQTNPFALVLRSGEVMVRVTLVDALAAQPFTVLGWQEDDITLRIGILSGAGVAFLRYDGMGQDELGVWTTPSGDKVAWFLDPDANVLSLTEFAAV
jgi:catechol 2,3-dioxygenase-like lactoylglutathione lyase family enzyme